MIRDNHESAVLFFSALTCRITQGMRFVGLTGGIACGKSTVANMLRQRGVPVLDADQIAREVVAPGEPTLQDIVAEFGENVLLQSGELDRSELAKRVFHDDSARQKLNQIMHPAIFRRAKEKRTEYATKDTPLLFYDIPLLFENHLSDLFDDIVVVWVPESSQRVRLHDRDGFSDADIDARIRAQWPIDQKKNQADFVIDNQGTREETESQVNTLLETLRHGTP